MIYSVRGSSLLVFRQPLPLVRCDIAFPFSRVIVSAYPSSFPCRVTSCFLLVFPSRFRFSFVVSWCVSAFRKRASCSFGFPSSYVVLRPVRLRSSARSLIVVFSPSFVFVRSFFASRCRITLTRGRPWLRRLRVTLRQMRLLRSRPCRRSFRLPSLTLPVLQPFKSLRLRRRRPTR